MRATSETKTTPLRTRTTRAGSVEVDNIVKADLTGTPVKRHTRASMIPPELIVIEEQDEIKKRDSQSMEITVAEVDENSDNGM